MHIYLLSKIKWLIAHFSGSIYTHTHTQKRTEHSIGLKFLFQTARNKSSKKRKYVNFSLEQYQSSILVHILHSLCKTFFSLWPFWYSNNRRWAGRRCGVLGNNKAWIITAAISITAPNLWSVFSLWSHFFAARRAVSPMVNGRTGIFSRFSDAQLKGNKAGNPQEDPLMSLLIVSYG